MKNLWSSSAGELGRFRGEQTCPYEDSQGPPERSMEHQHQPLRRPGSLRVEAFEARDKFPKDLSLPVRSNISSYRIIRLETC